MLRHRIRFAFTNIVWSYVISQLAILLIIGSQL